MSSSHKRKMYKLKIKRGVYIMTMKTVGASLIIAGMLSVAPIAGIAEPTETSVKSEMVHEQAGGLWDSVKDKSSAAFDQSKQLFSKTFGSDERLVRAKETNDQLRKRIIALESKLVEKRVTDQVQHAQAVSCVDTLGSYLTNDVEVK